MREKKSKQILGYLKLNFKLKIFYLLNSILTIIWAQNQAIFKYFDGVVNFWSLIF